MKKDLKGKRILVTAGPTREYIDAVRFISNPSTGRMGYAIAEAAKRRGASVTLISGPTHIQPPRNVKITRVISAAEMLKAVLRHFPKSHIVIKAAAVADYRPLRTFKGKKKKTGRRWKLPLTRTVDILATLGKMRKGGQALVGFAAESDALTKNSRAKLKKKKLDYIIANKIGAAGRGFGTTTHSAIIINSRGKIKRIKPLSKRLLAHKILSEVCLGPRQ